MPTLDLFSLCLGALVATVVTWALLRGRQVAAAAAERQARDAFAALAADALRQNSDQFIARASETLDGIRRQAASDLDLRQQSIAGVVSPLREHLERVSVRVEELDRIRQESYGAIRQQLESVALGQQDVAAQARHLVQALRAPQARGRWGELQLERVVELAGMAEHVDFTQQLSVDTAEGRLRPDLVVHLPGDRTIVVDAKTPLDAYLRAVEATDADARQAALAQHGQRRTHVGQLAAKTYWDQFSAAPDFVVMFVPGEAFLSAACLEDPQLLEDALHKRVILASPTMLVALLRTVALGWRHERLAEHAEHISGLAQELVERIVTVAEHLGTAGDKLEGAVKSYNQAVGSLESRVLVTARRVRELGVAGKKEVPTLAPVTQAAAAVATGGVTVPAHMAFHPAYFATRFRCPGAPPAWPDRFAIISACATTGEHWEAAREADADAALHAALVAREVWVARVTGYSPETGHAEPSWAAAIALADATALGDAFAQDAIYWVDGEALSVHRCRGDGAMAPVGSFRDRLD